MVTLLNSIELVPFFTQVECIKIESLETSVKDSLLTAENIPIADFYDQFQKVAHDEKLSADAAVDATVVKIALDWSGNKIQSDSRVVDLSALKYVASTKYEFEIDMHKSETIGNVDSETIANVGHFMRHASVWRFKAVTKKGFLDFCRKFKPYVFAYRIANEFIAFSRSGSDNKA